MKYILTESQYNLILESQKHEQFFQELIDSNLEIIRKECEDIDEYLRGDADGYEGHSDAETCRQLEEIDRIKVTNAEWVTIKRSNREQEEKYMSVKIMIYYSSIRKGDFDADELTYDLKQMIRKSTGMSFILNYESTNTNTQFNW